MMYLRIIRRVLVSWNICPFREVFFFFFLKRIEYYNTLWFWNLLDAMPSTTYCHTLKVSYNLYEPIYSGPAKLSMKNDSSSRINLHHPFVLKCQEIWKLILCTLLCSFLSTSCLPRSCPWCSHIKLIFI